MRSRLMGAAMLVAASLTFVSGASAELSADKAKAVAEAYSKSVALFGSQEKLQADYEEARAEQARVEGALQLSLNLEARLRANNATQGADIYLNAANSLRPVVDNLRTLFTKLEALDTPLDEARGQAAHDRVAAEHAALFQRPMTEQYEYSKTHPLKPEPLGAIQAMAGVLIAVAEK